MGNNTVSVIIPIYNAEEYIEQCIHSILNQTYSDLEIICVNDGSTDRTLQILERFKLLDSRVKIISTENCGVSHARNTGLDYATGRYIMFLDSDDYLDLVSVEKCINTISLQNVDCVIFNSCMFYSDGQTHLGYEGGIFKNIPFLLDGENCEFLTAFNNVCFMCYERSIIDQFKIRFPEGRLYEDWDFASNYLSKTKRCAWLNIPYYFYRITEKETNSRIVDERCLDIFSALHNTICYYQQSGRWENVQFCFYIKTLLHLIFFFNGPLSHAPKNVKEEYFRQFHQLIQDLPFEYIAAVLSHFGENERRTLFLVYSNSSYAIFIKSQKIFKKFPVIMRLRELIKKIVFKIFPSFRILSTTRNNIVSLQTEIAQQRELLNSILTQQNKLNQQFEQINRGLSALRKSVDSLQEIE